MALWDSVKFVAGPIYLLPLPLLLPLPPPPPARAGWGGVPQSEVGVVRAREQHPQLLLQLLSQGAVANHVSEDNVRL